MICFHQKLSVRTVSRGWEENNLHVCYGHFQEERIGIFKQKWEHKHFTCNDWVSANEDKNGTFAHENIIEDNWMNRNSSELLLRTE